MEKVSEQYVGQITQHFVMKLAELEEFLEIEIPRVDVELETEEERWHVVVTKKPRIAKDKM